MNARRLPAFAVAILAAACGRPDAAMVDVRPPAAPQRIVAGSLLATEVLLAIAPRERIAGVHVLAANPRFSLVVDAVAGLPQVGAEPEQLLAARPDLVIVDAFTRAETVGLLASAGVPVLRTAVPKSFDDIAANIGRIGRATHCDAAAAALVDTMRSQLADLAADDDGGLRSLRVMSLDGALHTLGKGSLFDAVVTAAGAANQAASCGVGPFRKLDVEQLLAMRPDVLVVDCAPGQEAAERAWIAQTPGFEFVPAVSDHRVLYAPGPMFTTTSHHLVDTVEWLRRELRPWRPQ